MLPTIIFIGVVLLIVIGPLFNWVPDLIYWLVTRRKQKDEDDVQLPPPLPRRPGTYHDDNAS